MLRSRMFADMKTSDWVIAFATLAGPILAVQAQKWFERWQSARQKRVEIFYALMGTRATRIAPAHVEALNRIDLEFRPRKFGWLRPFQSKRDRAVIDAWRLYGQHLNLEFDHDGARAWSIKSADLFFDLLLSISEALGFSYSKSELRHGVYHPKGHARNEELQQQLLENAIQVVRGESALSMRVVELPAMPDAPESGKAERRR